MKQGKVTAYPRRRSKTSQADLFEKSWETSGQALAQVAEQRSALPHVDDAGDSPKATARELPFHAPDNPYQGCDHGCVYCFARPSHRFQDHPLGLDFETLLYAKRNAAHALSRELDTPDYKPETLILGANSDPYQPVEKRQETTRDLLSVLLERKHPVSITTASTSVLRDLDILQKLASERLVNVFMSISTLDQGLAATLEPRVASPRRRLDVMEVLRDAGVSVGLLCSPLVPGLTDFDLERVIQKGHRAGASVVGYSLLQLAPEMRQFFEAWLREHHPEQADKVLNLTRETRHGATISAKSLAQPTGAGVYAAMIQQRFDRVVSSLEVNRAPIRLRKDLFVGVKAPRKGRRQIPLF